jgi:hypothetical protein
VLTAVNLDDETLFKAHEVENVVLKWGLSTELEMRKTSIAEQSPHLRFSVGWLATHRLCEGADMLGDRPMVRSLRREPLTRRLTA